MLVQELNKVECTSPGYVINQCPRIMLYKIFLFSPTTIFVLIVPFKIESESSRRNWSYTRKYSIVCCRSLNLENENIEREKEKCPSYTVKPGGIPDAEIGEGAM